MKINNITESRFLRVANEKFGTDLLSRFEKLDEEVQELFEAFGNSYQSGTGQTIYSVNISHMQESQTQLV